MGKDKLRKFRENETFRCMVQPATSEVLNCDHPLKGRWNSDFFQNDKPIVLELGCGKGDYTIDLWITFADPQIGREKKRLTAPLFMNRYRNFLKEGGIVHLKTDSRYLHEYSRAMAEQNELKILAMATDIYGEDRERLYESGLYSLCGKAAIDALFEVQTFYESQYLAQGFPITYLSFLADHEGAYISPEWAEDLWKDENHHFVVPSGLPVASKFYPES